MSGGLMALLDDVAAIARLAAASLDDIGAAAGKASLKAVGVVVDDTAVTPRYLTGFSPDRELPIIWRITKGSLRNKLVVILPAALLLSALAPWLITPILMLGGAYLCYEGSEKVYEALTGQHQAPQSQTSEAPSAAREDAMVLGATRTDFILSAEIMAISLAEVSDQPLLARAAILVVVAILITLLVYGVVGLIVKMDDIGLRLSRSALGASRAFGRSLVRGMPVVLSLLSVVGTAAMLWVGGHILLDGLTKFGFGSPSHALHTAAATAGRALPIATGMVAWLVETVGSGVVGLLVGMVVMAVMHLVPRRLQAP